MISDSNMAKSVSWKNGEWIDLIWLEPEASNFLRVTSHSLGKSSETGFKSAQ